MKYSYNLLSPLDYLKLLYLTFFKLNAFPMPDNLRNRTILILQGVALVVTACFLSGWLSNWWGDFETFLLLSACCVAFFLAFVVLGGVAVGVAAGVTVGVAAGVAGGVIGSVAGGLIGIVAGAAAACVAQSLANDVKDHSAIDIKGDIVVIIVSSVSFGLAAIVSASTAIKVFSSIGGPWGWFAGLGTAFVGLFVYCSIGIIITFLIYDYTEFVINKSSCTVEFVIGFFLLTFLSVLAGFLFPSLSPWLPTLSWLFPVWISGIIFLAISRLPLWPVEAAVGLLGYLTVLKFQKKPKKYRRLMKICFFDHHMFLPLPLETRAFCRLAALDWEEGIRSAVFMATNSGHRLAAAKALSNLSLDDPFGIRFHILRIGNSQQKERVLRHTYHRSDEITSHAVSATDILESLVEQIYSKDRKEEKKGSMYLQMKGILEPETEIGTPVNSGVVTTELGKAVDEMHLVQRLSGDKIIRHCKEMIALYGGIQTALDCGGAGRIAEYRTPFAADMKSSIVFPDSLIRLASELEEAAKIMTAYNRSTSRVAKLEAVAKTNEKLVSLEERIEKVPEPAGPLLGLVAAHWIRLLAKAGGEAARQKTLEPVSNPFVIGNPVCGDLFVGREDTLVRLEELWRGDGQRPSVVIYGHRRMGKSSILHNLKGRFVKTFVVDFNMQLHGQIGSTGELLYVLALTVFESMPESMRNELEGGEPKEDDFLEHNPQTAFNRFMKRLDRVRGQYRFIVTVDEFEILEERIEQGRLNPELLEYWRGLIQTWPWFVMALAGLHTLQEMTKNYWHPLYASVPAVPVSFLSPRAARRLITQPTPEFPIDYDQAAIDEILSLTGGQPYLVQLVCHGLVTRFNRQTFEEGKERERRFGLDDVQAVIGAPEFFRDGNAYFTGVWIQAEKSDPPEQTAVLKALCLSDRGQELSEIAKYAGLDTDTVQQALATLESHDVVRKTEGRWHFSVELMRRWVEKKRTKDNAVHPQ